MNIAEVAIQKKVITLVLTVVMLAAGAVSYRSLSRLEDPEFTIKQALVNTPYPGASASEVEGELTDRVEKAAQQLGEVDFIESTSYRGLSSLTVEIKTQYSKHDLPQIWDSLRRKVNDVQRKLPPGAGPSLVVDDYGDVYGVFVAVYGDEYSYAELKDYVDLLRRELLLVKDVAKIETFGEQPEAVYVELDRERMAQLGVSPAQIVANLRQKNVVSDAGEIEVGPEFIAIEPTGTIRSVKDFESLLITGRTGQQQIFLRDIARVKRGYVEPPTQILLYDGHPAIGLGISTVKGGNVVTMGEALKRRMQALTAETPLGIHFGIISLQSDAVTKAISGFEVSLVEAVVIVVVVLLIFMGLRSGLIIGFILLLTIFGTFIFMAPWGVALERISLGALIIALGMLVDNAIVVVDGTLVGMQRGETAARASARVVAQSGLPLLGATAVAILAFAAIGTSKDSTGEFCRSLFQVVFISLSLSWVTAVTVTPLVCVMFLKPPKAKAGASDPYDTGFYRGYRRMLGGCIRRRGLTVAVVLALFAAALWGFRYVDKSFFPPSTRPQFMVDFWLPQGTSIEETTRKAREIQAYLAKQEGVTHTTALVGQGGLRFLLTYTPEKANSAYAQFLVDVDSPGRIATLMPAIEAHLNGTYTEALAYASRFELGPGSNGKIRARFSGPEPDGLRKLGSQTVAIMEADGNAKAIRTDWRDQVKVIRPVVAEEQANLNGISREDIANALLQGFEGKQVGVYRERDLLLPITLRAAAPERGRVENLGNLQIWSPAAARYIPLRQVISVFETGFENELIQRRNRKPTMTVFCDPKTGPASRLFERLRPKIEGLSLPPGYELEWGGEYEDSADAQAGLTASLPMYFVIMVLIVIALFDSLRQPLVIWLCVPLAIIGVTVGLLLTHQPFGFMALLGFLSLSGMLIKNAIVLIDEINYQSSIGKPLAGALLEAGVNRLRPVAMAASTTALGMIPLLLDPFFSAMAVTIIFGLLFATLLTMILVPVLYAALHGVSAGSDDTERK